MFGYNFLADLKAATNLDFGRDYLYAAQEAWANGNYLSWINLELGATCEIVYDGLFAYCGASVVGSFIESFTAIETIPATSPVTTSFVAETASSTKLSQNLINSGISRPAQTAAHHIVAGSAKMAAPARAILSEYGISINSALNGVFLPANKNSINTMGSNIHSTLHTNTYYETVNTMLNACTSKQEVIETLDTIKNMLLLGEF